MKPPRRSSGTITVQDVARAAGVSAMTVSRVINQSGPVREETRERVQEAVRRLGYSPNIAARNLATGEPAQIGMLYANPSAVYLSQFLIGALGRARRAGCHLLIEPCEEETEQAQRQAARDFASMRVQGVLLPPPLSGSSAVTEELTACGIPYACVGAVAGPLAVRIDDFGAARAMTEYLIGLGHRNIGFIRGHPNLRASEQRWLGFRAALEAHGVDPAGVAVEQGYFTYASGLEAARALLAAPRRPTAIFASNDDMAAATIGVAHRRGLRVPQDLSVVGFDDSPLATSVWPELTTVHQPIAAMAEAALDLLLQRREQAEEVLPHELIVRESAGPPPA